MSLLIIDVEGVTLRLPDQEFMLPQPKVEVDWEGGLSNLCARPCSSYCVVWELVESMTSVRIRLRTCTVECASLLVL